MKKQTIQEFLKPFSSTRYRPVLDGKSTDDHFVLYTESEPSLKLSRVVQSYWMLKTEKKLEYDFILHALPDACINILFNQLKLNIAGITQLQTSSVELNLGKEFHFVGIQLNPGVLSGNRHELKRNYIDTGYIGNLPLLKTNRALYQIEFLDQITILENLVETLIDEKVLDFNPVIESILQNRHTIQSVYDMARLVNKSERQLQRIVNNTVGLSPRNFSKVLKLQQSFVTHYTSLYVDQAHYINSFKKATGYSPIRYAKKFRV